MRVCRSQGSLTALGLAMSLFFTVFCLPLSSQVTTANWYGIVQDPTGAVVPGAKVSITHRETNLQRSTTSNELGEFAFLTLPIGTYTIRIEAEGFKTYQASGIELRSAQTLRDVYKLELGAVTETVAVEAQAPLIQTASSEQLETITTVKVENLPIGRRNITSLLRLSTGVDRADQNLRINGLGRTGTAVTVDGTDANANPSESRATQQYGGRNYFDVISVEAVQEVQLIRGVVPAEYGGFVSGQINIISKAGTNEYHGSLFHLYRSHIFNARNPFQRNYDSQGRLLPKNREVYNQFGGSLGGPIIRDKLFFFGTYEGYRESVFQLVTGTVPTSEFKRTIRQALPFKETEMLLATLPDPTRPLDARRGRFEGAGKRERRENYILARGDYRVTNLSNLAVTFTHAEPFGLDPRYNLNHSNDRTYEYIQNRLTALYTYGSSQWVSETRFGWNSAEMERLDFYFKNVDPNKPERIPWQRRVPRLSIRGVGTWGDAEVWIMDGTTWTFEQKFSRIMGRHTIKFGGRYVIQDGSRDNPENPEYQFNNIDDMFANIAGTFRLSYGAFGPYNGRQQEWGIFIQDDWRATPRLTLNLGLRYDWYSTNKVEGTSDVPVVIKNLEPPRDWRRFDFGPRRPFDKPTENDGWVNLGPRVGFAYRVTESGTTVLRGGFATIFASHVPAIYRQSASHPVVPFRISWSRAEGIALGVRYPMYNEDTFQIAEQWVKSTGNELVFSLLNPGLQAPYTMNYSLNIQQQLARDLMWEIGYVGIRGLKFPMHRLFNLPDRVTGERPNPRLVPGGFYVDNSENTTYNSLQTALRKRFSNNFGLDVFYTWGKTISYVGADVGVYYGTDADTTVQDFHNLAIERGIPDHDITHNFVADFIYQLPFLQTWHPVAKAVLGGWQLSGIFIAQTGQPFNVTQSCAQNYPCRVDYVGGPAIFSNWEKNEVTAGCPVGVHCDVQYLNPAAFRRVPESRIGIALRPGNLGNGALRGPGFWNIDLAIAKTFRLREGMDLQFRIDMFNAFNHVSLTSLSTSIDAADFGRLRAARGMRSMQFNARLTF